jgi:hypothetical protein
MGYSHYFYREREIDAAKFAAIVEDFSKIVLKLDDLGVRLAGGQGEGTPVIGPDSIFFNGLKHCGHPENSEIIIPWPTQNAKGVVQGGGEKAGNWYAGVLLDARCCGGDCSYEPFYLPRDLGKDFVRPSRRYPTLFSSNCKTAYRPYDLAVNAVLVIAKHHLGDKTKVVSDGDLPRWIEAIELCRQYLGYPETYKFNSDRELMPEASVSE